MKIMFDELQDYLSRPIAPRARLILLALIIPLGVAITQPLWRISMTAPQYPNGLYMDVFAYTLVGGNEGQHITEINTLNHYIGMHKLDVTSFADLDWIPFALGALAILALRTAAMGRVRDLVDLVVVTGYVSAFAFGRFVYRLWIFGHHLDPKAPVKVEPFMPVVLGHKTIANFETYSMPRLGSYLLGVFVVGTVVVLVYHLWVGRRQATRAAAGVATTAASVVAVLLAAVVLSVGTEARGDPPPVAGGSEVALDLALPASADGCVDHAVRELGMSAKKREGARAWDVHPRFIHPAVVAGGQVELTVAPRPGAVGVAVRVRWPGPEQPADVQGELEARVSAMGDKLAQICGVLKPDVTCRVTTPQRSARPCAREPARPEEDR